MLIRPLEPTRDLQTVTDFYAEAPDYWRMLDGVDPGPEKAHAFFTDIPPGCDPATSHHLGLFLEGRLSGLADLSFGFPDPGDAYMGLMLLGPWARGGGHGARFLSHVEGLARAQGATRLLLAVAERNPRGGAFWRREGFTDTGRSGLSGAGPSPQVLHRLVKPL
ncbi:GNAT family N-acetyltransferase [Aliiroseovarius sp.]|uniref:GNAT family N-acetyltransferase n=1 Tax=Aliiroseovarius sp. TaxID=1872442 RepID=UPI003BA92F98